MKFQRPAILGFLAFLALACTGPGAGTTDESDRQDDDEPSDDAPGGSAGSSGGVGGRAMATGGSGTAGAGGNPGSGGSGGGTGGAGSAAGSGGAGGADANPDGGVPPGMGGAPQGKPAIVAVGYAGRRRISRDFGATWEPEQVLGGGGDDQFLLRDAAFGAGRAVAVGWKFLSTVDGKTWVEHKNPHGQWQGGVAWGNDMFIAVGGLGRAAKSRDGVSWQTIPNAGGSHIRRVCFKDGVFWATGDSGTVYSTTDGTGWKTGGSYPGDSVEVAGTKVRMGGGGVEVSTDGGPWRSVLRAGWIAGVAAGYLAEP